MYERFTDRARKLMQNANAEACRLRHEYIGSEHMLLALCDDQGVAGTVLDRKFVNRNQLRERVEARVQLGPDVLVVGGKYPQTPEGKRIIDSAITAARTNGHNYVGTEHLLLAMTQHKDSLAGRVLTEFGVTEDVVWKELGELLENWRSAAVSHLQDRKLDAVADQDFALATRLRDDVQALKKQGAGRHSDNQEVIRRATGALLKYYAGEAGAVETVRDLRAALD